jgi:acyl-CoA thioester hydrolase
MKKNMPENMKHVYTSIIPMRWGDMDAMGHVNNTVYFRFLEQARIEWYAFIGRERNAGMETVVVNAHCTFMVALTWPGEVEVRTYAGNPGRSSFDIVQEIRRTDNPDVVCARGGARVVWVDRQTGKSAPLPDMVRQMLAVDQPAA